MAKTTQEAAADVAKHWRALKAAVRLEGVKLLTRLVLRVNRWLERRLER